MLIYGLGSNGSGQLGIGHKDDVSTPTAVLLPPHLQNEVTVATASGGNHTLFRFESGSVYAAGCNDDGRCALSASSSEVTTPQPTIFRSTGSKVLLCAATWSTSIFVTSDGSVLSCGSGPNGELGLGPDRQTANVPSKITSFEPTGLHVTQLAASMAHAVAVLSDGTILGWGNGKNGQVGDPAEVVWTPRNIAVPFSVASVACGKDFTCLLSGPDKGEILVLGPNRRDRFGIRNSIPKAISPILTVQATWGSIFVRDSNGLTKAWGRNDRGQRGPADELSNVSYIATGSEHVVGVTTDDRAIVWGWGEHGNCGLPVDDTNDVKDRANSIDVSGRVIAIGAGCATTFVVTDT